MAFYRVTHRGFLISSHLWCSPTQLIRFPSGLHPTKGFFRLRFRPFRGSQG